MKYHFTLFFCFVVLGMSAQYQFTHSIDIPCSPVKNQAATGTCWSFATASFLETEMQRKGFNDLNLSEMYVVRNIYKDKAWNYVLRQGKANFSQGSLSHDLIAAVKEHGMTTEKAYSGLLEGENSHNHSEMESGLKGFLDGIIGSRRISDKWPQAFSGILDAYLGEVPSSFEYNGKIFTPKSFADYLGIDENDYVSLTSFSHQAFYEEFILEIPDNYSNGSFYNIPIEELMALIDGALQKGYSVAWDGDVSEKTFDAGKGLAILPKDPQRDDLYSMPGEELEVNQEIRQKHFESYSTTDDHLMHLVGMAKDQQGKEYYIIKNSWGEISPFKGFLYMSKSYAAMKTVAIMVHKDALSEALKNKISD